MDDIRAIDGCLIQVICHKGGINTNNSKIIAVVVAIIVVIVAVAAVLYLGGSSEASKNKEALSKSLAYMDEVDADYPYLMILGNANWDWYIDEDDIKYIESLIEDEDGYDYVEEFMCDANYDGIIDKKDIEMVEKLMDYNNYYDVVYYINSDYHIRSYDMSRPLYLANILTQTLEIECILAPEAIVATDYRCGMPSNDGQSTFWTEYISIIEKSTGMKYEDLGNIGTHKTVNAELITEVARKYGNGDLTVWFNSESENNTSALEEQLAGTNVQVIRLPSFENASTLNGVLTAGYFFHKFDRAVEWGEWYSGYMNQILELVDQLTDDQKVKVLASYLATSEDSPGGEYWIITGHLGEYQNLLKLGVIDVVAQLNLNLGSGWKVELSDEGFAAVCQEFGCDLMVGTVPGPFGSSATGEDAQQITQEYIVNLYNERYAAINEYTDTEVKLVVYGWIWASGPMELTYLATLGNYLYGWDLDVETITNEGLEWLGIYGDGEYQYTYQDVVDKLWYAPEAL